jgi:glyoxylate reductase
MGDTVFVTRALPDAALAILRQRATVDEHRGLDLAREELIRRARGKAALVTILEDRIDEGVLKELPGLRVVSNVAVGVDNIDVAAATARGVIVTNTPGVLDETTADFVFGLLLATARKIVAADAFVRQGLWKRWELFLHAGMDVHAQTLGIVGLGRIGKGVARRARGFGMRVLYTDTVRASEEIERELGVKFVDKATILAEADFLTLHVPLTEATRHYIGAAEFGRMKRTAILINASRGPVVDPRALIEALRTQRIWGAGLDVFEGEPKLPPELLELPNLVITPHIASSSIATRTLMAIIAAENTAAVLSGRTPRHVVNPEVLQPAAAAERRPE